MKKFVEIKLTRDEIEAVMDRVLYGSDYNEKRYGYALDMAYDAIIETYNKKFFISSS